MIFSGKGDKLSVYPPFLHLENPHEKGKSGSFPLFLKKSGFFSKKVLTKQFGHIFAANFLSHMVCEK